ncbi:hypothetical protein T08_12235 [Trichinella sp. T8]|nr:hypothetical protein T08_12235 [Trichinella sp. T8]
MSISSAPLALLALGFFFVWAVGRLIKPIEVLNFAVLAIPSFPG